MDNSDSSKIFFLKFFIFSIFLLLIAVAYAFISDSTNRNTVSNDNILIDVPIQDFVDSGDSISTVVSVTNRNNSFMRSAKVQVSYEESFDSSDVVSIKKQEIDIGDIAPLSLVNKEIVISFIGKQEDIRKINAKLSYSVDGASAVFVKEYNRNIKISNNKFLLNIKGKTEPIIDLENFFTVDLKNISTAEYKNLYLKINLPNNFNITSSSSEKVAKVFSIDKISVGEEKNFDFKGFFKGSQNEKKNFRVYVYTNDSGVEKVLAESKFEVLVAPSPLDIILVAEVDNQKVLDLSLGQDAKLDFIVTNINDYALDELIVKVNYSDGTQNTYSFNDNEKLKRLNPKDTVSFSRVLKSVKASTTEVYVDVYGKNKGSFNSEQLLNRYYSLRAK